MYYLLYSGSAFSVWWPSGSLPTSRGHRLTLCPFYTFITYKFTSKLSLSPTNYLKEKVNFLGWTFTQPPLFLRLRGSGIPISRVNVKTLAAGADGGPLIFRMP